AHPELRAFRSLVKSGNPKIGEIVRFFIVDQKFQSCTDTKKKIGKKFRFSAEDKFQPHSGQPPKFLFSGDSRCKTIGMPISVIVIDRMVVHGLVKGTYGISSPYKNRIVHAVPIFVGIVIYPELYVTTGGGKIIKVFLSVIFFVS